MRIGNEEYARENKSYGLTTLRYRHAAVSGDRLRLRFRAKSGKEREVALDDPGVARVVRRCQAMPGQDLFQYAHEEDSVRGVGPGEVNDYLREAGGADSTAKDFRTDTARRMRSRCGSSAAEQRRQAAEREGASLGSGEAPRQYSRGVQEVVRPSARARGAGERDRSRVAELDDASRRAGLSAGDRRLLAFLARD